MARKFPVKGLTPALCLAALVLTGCGAQRSAASTPTATTAAVASTPTATPAAAPLASATTGYPSSMAVLGHSNATGEDSDPAQPHTVIRANSWATGTNPAVNSVYLRILAKNPAIKSHNYNLAQPSATVDALLLQARQAVTLTPKPGLFLVQIMDADIVCPATHGDYAAFRSRLITALGVLARGAPHARIFVVSQWGSPATSWQALRPAQRLQFVAGDQGGGGTGPCAFIDPRGRLVPKEDAGALAEGILALLADPAERTRLGERARAASADYDIGACVRGMESLYEEVLAEGPS